MYERVLDRTRVPAFRRGSIGCGAEICEVGCEVRVDRSGKTAESNTGAGAREELARLLRHRALELGFDDAACCAAEPVPEMSRLAEWIRSGRSGALAYMRDHLDVRMDPRLLLPGARSVLMVAKSYLRLDPGGNPVAGPVSSHASGRDYHSVLKKRLWEVGRGAIEAGGRFKLFVDSAPVMEKVIAARAGLGRIGRNSLLVHPRLGSWIVLGGLVTDLELEASAPPVGEGGEPPRLPDCDGCRRCVDACPAGAIALDGAVDAGRCLSYWTIECAGEWPEWVGCSVAEQVYGCDRCQQVCPANRGALPGRGDDFAPFPFDGLTPVELAEWDATRFRNRTRRSSMRRIRFEQFHRNALACADAERRLRSPATKRPE